MPQASLMGWLNKPVSIPTSPHPTSTSDDQNNAKACSPLPTPPPSSTFISRLGEGQRDESKAGASVDSVSTPKSGKDLTKKLASTIPPNVHLRPCTKQDIPAFKRLNTLLLPILYPESFYRETIEDPLTNNITLLATWHDDPPKKDFEKGRLVGAVRCRILAHPPGCASTKDSKPMLYLSTLVLLSPYRSHGIASHLLSVVLKRAVENYGVGSVGAHVWEANKEGLEWYAKRGFMVVGREEGYYRRLKPQGAVVVKRELSVMDLVG